jgi:adenylylsulfate kinase-like enzyme
VQAGLVTAEQCGLVRDILFQLRIWLLVNSDSDKVTILSDLQRQPIEIDLEVYVLDEVRQNLESVLGSDDQQRAL